ncbi:response regulator [Pedobacter sp. GSP4]|uniref:response regulator n=1 Tax=Pedobacter sp. GSP4 TaxID=3453716 RepID=UPI003EEDC807
MIENAKILIADDSEIMRLLMKRFFTRLFASPVVLETANLPDTLKLLEQQQVDFLLLDINMPKGDSNPKTVSQILSIQPHIKVCMFSGNDKAMLEQQYYAAGAIGFVQKDESMGTAIEQVISSVFG